MAARARLASEEAEHLRHLCNAAFEITASQMYTTYKPDRAARFLREVSNLSEVDLAPLAASELFCRHAPGPDGWGKPVPENFVHEWKEVAPQHSAAALAMRHKTYLTPEQQWDRSVGMMASHRKYFVDAYRLGIDLGLGRVVGTHKLFRSGDIVIVLWTSWDRNRCRVAAVSSKGYAVFRFFMRLCQGNGEPGRAHGSIQLVDLPDHVTNKRPDDPAVRQFVVGPLRAGDAALSGRRE